MSLTEPKAERYAKDVPQPPIPPEYLPKGWLSYFQSIFCVSNKVDVEEPKKEANHIDDGLPSEAEVARREAKLEAERIGLEMKLRTAKSNGLL